MTTSEYVRVAIFHELWSDATAVFSSFRGASCEIEGGLYRRRCLSSDLVKVVFDTNVIVAGLVARGLCHELVEAHVPLHEAILSQRLWDELVRNLRDKFELEIEDLPLLHLYRRHAEWVEPQALEAPVSRDPDDDWVLATAVAGKAEVIVTGDDDLLTLGSFSGIEILTPRQFLELDLSNRR